MKQYFLRNRKPLVAAVLMSGAVGLAGQGLAQSTSGDQSGASTAQRPPAAADTGSSSGAYSASPGSPSGQSTSPSGTGSMTSAKGIAPSKSEMSDSAFKKLDANNKGYVTRDDAKALSGFDSSFQAADSNHDGKLTADEFKKAWTSYSGNTQ